MIVLITRGDNEINAAPDMVAAGNNHPLRLASRHHVVQNYICDILMEVAFISKAPKIKLDRFRFKTKFVRLILDGQVGEVGLPRHRAERRKFSRLEADRVIINGMRIRKSL